MTRAWWIAAGIVAAANAAALGGAAWNRSAEPEAVLELTERELELPPATAENTALALRLRWTDQANGVPGPVGQASRPVSGSARFAPWFDRAKLAEVGFDCTFPLEKGSAERYRAAPPRRVYAVLEDDGEAWRALERSMPGQGDRFPASRLVVVDAGLDPATLRARWPDRSRAVVVPATAALVVESKPDGSLALGGRIVDVYPSQLNVPRPLNQVLAPLQGRTREPAARYRVRVVWGRRDPWITEVTVGR